MHYTEAVVTLVGVDTNNVKMVNTSDVQLPNQPPNCATDEMTTVMVKPMKAISISIRLVQKVRVLAKTKVTINVAQIKKASSVQPSQAHHRARSATA